MCALQRKLFVTRNNGLLNWLEQLKFSDKLSSVGPTRNLNKKVIIYLLKRLCS